MGKTNAHRQQVHSFDLVARNSRITACDISRVPLPSGSVHAVVFCLSLMGTNMMDFVREASRVLRPKGVIKVRAGEASVSRSRGGACRLHALHSSIMHPIAHTHNKQVAEVRSRFEGQEGGIEAFVAACKALGLACRWVDKGNKMFFLADFVKEEREGGGAGSEMAAAVTAAAAAAKWRDGGKGGKKRQNQQQGKGKGKDAGGNKDAAVVHSFQAKACLYKRR